MATMRSSVPKRNAAAAVTNKEAAAAQYRTHALCRAEAMAVLNRAVRRSASAFVSPLPMAPFRSSALLIYILPLACSSRGGAGSFGDEPGAIAGSLLVCSWRGA